MDNISAKFLKSCGPVISHTVSCLINETFKTSKFPHSLKCSAQHENMDNSRIALRFLGIPILLRIYIGILKTRSTILELSVCVLGIGTIWEFLKCAVKLGHVLEFLFCSKVEVRYWTLFHCH